VCPAKGTYHDNGGRALRELHEVHEEDAQRVLAGAAEDLREVDNGGHVVGSVHALQHAQLVVVALHLLHQGLGVRPLVAGGAYRAITMGVVMKVVTRAMMTMIV